MKELKEQLKHLQSECNIEDCWLCERQESWTYLDGLRVALSLIERKKQ